MKPDEERLLVLIHAKGSEDVRRVIDGVGMNCKRALYILDKWTHKGWYDWGTSLDLGWLTSKGKEVAEGLCNAIR